MNERREIEALGTKLAIGESARGVCPFCRGGSSREDSFRVLRETAATVHYKCFRAKCGRWGYVGADPRDSDPHVAQRQPRRLITYDKPQVKLPYRVYAEAPISSSGKRLGDFLTYEECLSQGFTYGPEDARVIMPIFDYRGYPIGCIARGVGGARNTRNLTFREHDAELFHFPQQEYLECGRKVVCTEDLLSAVVVSRVAQTCSTLGTNFTEAMAQILRRIRIDTVQFFFDGDTAGYQAATKAVKRASSFQIKASLVPCPLGYDPKDLNQREIERLVL